MKKKISLLLTICMLVSTITAIPLFFVQAQENVNILLRPSNFENLGTWRKILDDYTFRTGEGADFDTNTGKGYTLAAAGAGPHQEATAEIIVPVSGQYTIWVRTKNAGYPSDRPFQILANGTAVKDSNGDDFCSGKGPHDDTKYFKWESSQKVDLTAGKVTISLAAINGMSRVDALFITNNSSFTFDSADGVTDLTPKWYKANLIAYETAVLSPSTDANPSATPSQVKQVAFKDGKNYIILTPESFAANMGIWQTTNDTRNGFYPVILQGGINNSDNSAQPAVAKVGFPKAGTYKVMVHCRDFATSPGTRPFKVQIGNGLAHTYGTHLKDSWEWQIAEEAFFAQGEVDLKLIDYKGNYARADMIVITDDLDFTVDNSADNMKTLAAKAYVPGSVINHSDGVDADRPPDEIAVKFNGQYMKFDVEPFIENGRTLVPMRAIFESLGCEVLWDGENQTATGIRNGKNVSVTIGSGNAVINAVAVKLDQSAVLKDGRTFVPLRFISEAFDAVVEWQENTKTVNIQAIVPKEAHFIVAESFKEIGTWALSTSDQFGTSVLIGNTKGEPADTKPALADFDVKNAGQYRIWVHARDFATNQPGSRFFDVSLNGTKLPTTFGQHGKNGFFWTDGGLVDLKAGTNEIALIDSSAFFARCDGIFITADTVMTPPAIYEDLLSIARPIDLFAQLASPAFPSWAKESYDAQKEDSIENDTVKVVFAKASSEHNGVLVQNEIYVKDNGNWVKVKDKAVEHGYLMLAAKASEPVGITDGFTVFKQSIDLGDKTINASTSHAYKGGIPVWLIPSDFEKVADKKVILTFSNPDYADVTVTWELDGKDTDPKVTLNAAFKKDGAYSFALSSGGEYTNDSYENALAPFIIMEKRVPENPNVYIEQYLFTPMGCVTLPENNEIVPGKKLTTGVVVDPESIPLGWVYRDTSRFGVSMRGPSGGVRGNIFAPLFGSDYCTFKAGDSYTISYRVINKLDTWFETYKHIAQNIFQVHDYRSNYYTSLNDAIYNTTDLMMNDDYGGWDPIDKAHYNMEEKDLTSVGNPMAAIQRYLLTEDDEILRQRAIPTLANLLTRGNIHFKRFDSTGGQNYLPNVQKPTPVGAPIAGFNLNVYGGLYEMSHGLIPALLDIGIAKSDKVVNAYGSIPAFTNDLTLYRYTNDEKHLTSSKEKADQYLNDVVYNKDYNSKLASFGSFIFISYYPNLASLIDIYQATGEQRYLDAAIKAGQMLATTLWVPGIDGTKGTDPYTIVPEETLKRPYLNTSNHYWHGSVQWRLGNDKGQAKPPAEGNFPLKEETVPGWLPARVGLGLEQGSTFPEAFHIIMSSWAGDMVKLSALSGDTYFETVARNAIIGRFSNYSGYYQNRLITHQMKPGYPYEGPDLTSIYWHHIPPFLAMLEDFLINQVWSKSGMQIEFPSVRQQGYAYFNSNQYGFESGKFYDQTDMWLWNDRGIIKPDSIQINYLAAKKDGVLAVALMNEADTSTTTTITLGEKVIGGSDYFGILTIYEQDGTKSETVVTEGKFTIEIPAKGMRSVVIKIPGVKAPAYSSTKYNVAKADLGSTVTEHGRGKAYLLQLSPNKYFAYVYIIDMAADAKEMKVNYKIGDMAGTAVALEYPFEVIVEVDDPSKDFTYDIEVTKTDGSKEHIKGSTLKPVR